MILDLYNIIIRESNKIFKKNYNKHNYYHSISCSIIIGNSCNLKCHDKLQI